MRAVAAALELRGHEVALPARLEDNPGIISEMIKRAGPILRQMEGPEPMELEERIFLSFSSQDEAIVRAFRTELAHRGVRTWIFTSSIRGIGFGPNWVDGELQALSTCCGFVVFFSRSSMESKHVVFELDFTLERMKRRSGIFFCVVFLEELPRLFPETVPMIDLYKMQVAEAAKCFIEKAVAFHRTHIDSHRERIQLGGFLV